MTDFDQLFQIILIFIGLFTFIIGRLAFLTGLAKKKAILAVVQDEIDQMPLNRQGKPVNSIVIKSAGIFPKDLELIVLKRMVLVFPYRRILGLKYKLGPCIMFDRVSLKDKLFSNQYFYEIFRINFWESTDTITFWYQASTNQVEFSERYHRIKIKGKEAIAFVKMIDQHTEEWNSKVNWKG